jgi:hypothetical protein
MNFPLEIMNHILSFRPVHPVSLLIKNAYQDYVQEKEYRYMCYVLCHEYVHIRMSFEQWALARWETTYFTNYLTN